MRSQAATAWDMAWWGLTPSILVAGPRVAIRARSHRDGGFYGSDAQVWPDGRVVTGADHPGMTSPVVTELPLVLQPLTQDTFTHAAMRPLPAPQPLKER